MTEYIRDPRFHPHGFSYAWGTEEPTWTTSTAAEVFAATDWSQTVVVAHNVKFDGAILAWHYGVQPYAWFDTAGLARAVLGERIPGFSLKTCAEYLGLPAKGDLSCDGVRNPSAEQLATLGAYCNNDVALCRGIYDKLFAQFPQSQLWHMDWTIRAFVDARLTLNTALLEEGVINEKKRREEAIQRSGVDRATLSSNQKFAAHLVSVGHDVVTKRSPRTGKQIPAFGKSDDGITALPEDLRNARMAAKSSLLETRGESLLAVGRTGNFPFDVNFSGAVQTHRYSGGSGAGGNPQNFTRGSFLRGAVSTRMGTSLVVGDFAAIELRILSWLAREPKLINAIVNNGDIYLDFAKDFFKRRLTKKEHAAERHFGKGAILGLGYGMGGKKFFSTVKALRPLPSFTPEQVAALKHLVDTFTQDDADKTVALYRSTYFNVSRLWQSAQDAIPLIADGRVSCLHFAPFVKVRKEALILPSGLAIQYPNLRAERGRFGHLDWCYDIASKKKSKDGVCRLYGGKLVENLCQAIAGDLCKEAIYRAETQYGLPCAGAVHDEIIAIGDNEAALEACMSKSPTWWPDVRLKSEVHIGNSWLEAK